MDPVTALPGSLILQILIAFAVASIFVGVISSSIRELQAGYWILGWSALLITGACNLAKDAGYPIAGSLSFMTDAFFGPLMLMGAFELHVDRPTPRWPLFLGLAAGTLRIAFDLAGWPDAMGIHGLLIAPSFFAGAAFLTWTAPRTAAFRVPIAILLGTMVGVELWDAWGDWQAGENRILWTAILAVCVPLAALQIASRLIAFNDRLVSARAASSTAEQELDLERWRFEVVFDHAKELVAELGGDTRILFVNGRVRELMGLDPDALIGKRALDYVPAEHRAEAERIWQQHMKLEGLGGPVTFPVADAKGDPLYLEITVADYELPGESRLLAIARDVTQRVEVEREQRDQHRLLEERVAERSEQLRASLSRLRDQERLATVGTLASGIAHQINNPIGAISAAAEFAISAAGEPDAPLIQQEALRRIVDEARRTGRIVKNVLRFARHGSTTKWPEDLGGVVRRSAEMVRPYVHEREGTLQIDTTPVPLSVMMSPIEIEQMVVNLVRNAAESRPGGASIRVSTRQQGKDALLEVWDDGVGIASEDRSRVFDPFFTTRLRDGGSGLGLSVVHGIVTDHDGTISVDSQPGQGTLVIIRFPLVESTAAVTS